jgi:ribonuclease P/MRP protein subunit POP7
MSLVRHVRKALEKAPSRGAGRDNRVPLAARVAAVSSTKSGSDTGGQQVRGVIEDRLDDVMLVATGRAIATAVEVGGFFTRERELAVLVRTRTVQAVDDVVVVDEEADADVEDQVRVRNVSCVEVGIRWAS